MPKGKPNKSHIAVALKDRSGEAVVPRAGVMLHLRARESTEMQQAPGCEWFVIVTASNTWWGVNEDEYNRLKGELS